MGRDDDIQAILDVGRRTRKRPSRWLSIAAIVVGVICATAFAIAMLREREREPATSAAPRRPDLGAGSDGGAGFASGLVIGLAGGVAIGFALGRQRRDHSSRNSP